MSHSRSLAIIVALLVLLALVALLVFARGQPVGDGSSTPTPAASVGVAVHNLVHYQLEGGLYSAEGIADFDGARSTFAGTGWVAAFSSVDGTHLQIRIQPGALAIEFRDPSYGTTASVTSGCAIDITRNDSSGFAGRFTCHALPGAYTASGVQGGEPTTADFSGSFEAHLAGG